MRFPGIDIRTYSLLTDDTKQGGPYMSLLQFEDDVMPFTFADVLILRFLMGITDELQTVKDFDAVNTAAKLDWAFRSQLSKFIRRFLKNPYREEDTVWIREFEKKYGIKLKEKLGILGKLLQDTLDKEKDLCGSPFLKQKSCREILYRGLFLFREQSC